MKKTTAILLLIGLIIFGGAMTILQNRLKQEKEDLRVSNTITTIDKFDAINEQLKNVDDQTLVILDVDYTLLQPSNPAYQQANFKLSPDFIKAYMKALPESIKNEFATSVATSGESQLIEEKIPSIIESFKQKGARILIISGILSGQWGSIQNTMEWRISNLKKAGIEPSAFDGVNYEFTDLKAYKGKYPEIKNGIIITNGEIVKKHEALDAFLKKIGWQPKKIIFVDDNKGIVEAMAEYSKQNNISFFGYEYKGAKLAQASPITKENLENEWNSLKAKLITHE